MNTKGLFGAAVSLLLLAGCQTPRGGDMAPAASADNADCPPAVVSPVIPRDFCAPGGPACGISVQVVPDGAGQCKVVIGTNLMQMRKNPPGYSGDTWLFWWLAGSPAWEFRSELTPFSAPVIFKDPGASAQFRSSHATEGGRFAWIRNLNTNKTEYQYQIRVYKRGTNTFIQSPDPAILNDN